jgi:FtsZ-binding cell division protein ZapB
VDVQFYVLNVALFASQLSKLQDELERKETKWSSSVAQLQEKVKYLERENQHLHEENCRLKLKSVAPKVG